MTEERKTLPGVFSPASWLLGFLAISAASAVAWFLVAYSDLPWLAPCVLAAGVGWVLYRLAHANTKGIVLWCLAVATLSVRSWLLAGEAVGLAGLCALAASGFLMASVVVFLVAAARDRTRRGRNCACCNLALFTLIAWGAVGINVSNHERNQQAVRHTTETLLKLHKLAAEIEFHRERLGRLPEGEEELVALRGEPMPTFYQQYQIHYQRVDERRYDLECSLSDFWGYDWDIFGWIVLYHGPDAPRRIQVIFF